MRGTLALAACALAACEAPPPAPPLLGGAFAPVHVVAAPGVVAPASCLAGRASGYGPWPPRCALDAAFGAQLAHPSDAVHPRPPGPAPTLPAALAAEAYLGVAVPGGDRPDEG